MSGLHCFCLVATITAVTVVVVGVEQGIILAIVLSIVIHFSHSYRPSDATLVPMPRGHWQTTEVDQNKEAEPGLVVYFSVQVSTLPMQFDLAKKLSG